MTTTATPPVLAPARDRARQDTPFMTPLLVAEMGNHPWRLQPRERCVVVDGQHTPREFVYEGRNNLGTPIYRDPLDGAAYPKAMGETILPCPKTDNWFTSDDLARQLLGWDDPSDLGRGDPFDDRDRVNLLTSADNLRLVAALALRIAAQQEARYVAELEPPPLSFAWGAADEDGERYAATAPDGTVLLVRHHSGERWTWDILVGAIDRSASGMEVGREQAMAAAEKRLNEGVNL